MYMMRHTKLLLPLHFLVASIWKKNNYACDIVLSSSYGKFYMIVIHKYVPHLR